MQRKTLLENASEIKDSPIDLSVWGRTQELLAGVLGTNFVLFAPNGIPVTPPSQCSPYCHDMIFCTRPDPEETAKSHCLQVALRLCVEEGQTQHRCVHGLVYGSVKRKKSSSGILALIVGPVLTVSWPSEEARHTFCRELGIDEEIYSDRIREIKTFSHHGFQLLLELGHHLLDTASLRFSP